MRGLTALHSAAKLSWGLCHKSSRRRDGPGRGPHETPHLLGGAVSESPSFCTSDGPDGLIYEYVSTIFPTGVISTYDCAWKRQIWRKKTCVVLFPPKTQLVGELWLLWLLMLWPWLHGAHHRTPPSMEGSLHRSTDPQRSRHWGRPCRVSWSDARKVAPKKAPNIQKKCEETEEMSSFESWIVASEVHMRSYLVDNVGFNNAKYSSMLEWCVGCIRQCTFHLCWRPFNILWH